MRNLIKDLALMSILAGILLSLETALAFIPNIQLTFLLLLIYSKRLGTIKTLIIIFVHVLIDTMLFGGLMSIYMVSMLVGYAFIPLLANTVLRRVKNVYVLALFSGLSGLLYAWSFIPPTIILYNVPILGYLAADIPFTAVLIANNILTTLILYKPIDRIFQELMTGEI